MLRRNSAPFAVFLQFNLASYELAVLARPVVGALALVAGNLYELVLGHGARYYIEVITWSTRGPNFITPRKHCSRESTVPPIQSS